MKRILIGVGTIFGLGLIAGSFVGWLITLQATHRQDLPPESGPVVLAMQRIGELHTASFMMKDVIRQESQSEPEGWAQHLPGAQELVHWSTHNQAIVVAEGKVEAGIDLSHLSEQDVSRVQHSDGKTVLRIHLPAIKIYPPTVQLRVQDAQSGLLWKDQNIVPKAQETAAQGFRKAAEQSGIQAQAQANAIQTLKAMQKSMGQEVEFYF